MRNIPTDIYIENEAVKNHGGEIAELGQKAMIVTGRHSSAVNGSLDDVKAVFESQGIGYVIYNDIEENPSVETVYTAATAAVKYGVDMFVAVGGGTPAVHQPADGLSARHRSWLGAPHRRGHVGKAPAPERGHPDQALPL